MNPNAKTISGLRFRRVLLALLVGINVILALALTMSTLSSPGAYAQVGVGGGQYLMAAAKAQGRSSDAFYVLDIPGQMLYAFIPGLPQRSELQQAEPRDLKKDFSSP
jgi:ABC-type Fe3+-siderophore transport system permease subunit